MIQCFLNNTLFLIIFFLIESLRAQNPELKFSSAKILTDTSAQTQLALPHHAASVAVKAYKGTFKKSYIKADGHKYYLKINNESERPDFIVSELIFLKNEADTISFYSGDISGEVEIHSFKPSEIDYATLKRAVLNTCGEPSSIPPSVWRKDLPPPVRKPDSTIVKHVIIHHSATVIENVDPVNALRNIYLYHTKTNGWDDIGYNYLIAPDGTIFQGRDDFGLYQRDNVRGSHFCGKNSNTMGICVLGNYMNIKPDEAAIAALVQLISWKTLKENINPTGSSGHPVGSSALLPGIAGHRDGCATDCPGDFLYSRLNEIRMEAGEQEKMCEVKGAIVLYPNPAQEHIHFKNHPGLLTYDLYDVSGKNLLTSTNVGEPVNIGFLPSGLFFIRVHTGTEIIKFKFIKI